MFDAEELNVLITALGDYVTDQLEGRDDLETTVMFDPDPLKRAQAREELAEMHKNVGLAEKLSNQFSSDLSLLQ